MAYSNAKKRTSIATRYTSFLNEKKSVVQKKEKSSPKIFGNDSKIIAASSGSGFFVTRQNIFWVIFEIMSLKMVWKCLPVLSRREDLDVHAPRP